MRSLVALALAVGLAPPLAAQEGGQPVQGVPQSAVVVLDRDVLFASSRFGQRAARDIETATNELAAENRLIEAELEAEEQALTDRRATLDPTEFRSLALDFDTRVTEIRQTQLAKERAIALQGERAKQIFFDRANPVLAALARETGALVILDRRMVIASADQVDITGIARDRLDAALGDGGALVVPLDAPQPAPDVDGTEPRTTEP